MITVDFAQRLGSFSLQVAFESHAPITALFGRSGAGKTSVINALAGVTQSASGRIVINGETVLDSTRGVFVPPEKRRIGYVFQEGLLFPHLTVYQNLHYGRKLSRTADRFIDANKIIALLGLESLLERMPQNLSGGEKQRVALGRALLTSPRLLLMDEPLARHTGCAGARKQRAASRHLHTSQRQEPRRPSTSPIVGRDRRRMDGRNFNS